MRGWADLRGRIAIVTGASSGIGASIAERFGREGMRVALAARRVPLLEAVAARVAAGGGEPLIIPTDVRDAAAITGMAEATLRAWGRVDVLVANAGIAGGSILRLSDDALVELFDVNLLGVIRSARAVLPSMVDRREGHIIAIASLAGRVMAPATAYGVTKAGVLAFCDSLRRGVAASGIAVSAVLPGWVDTALLRTRPRWLVPPSLVAEAVTGLLRRPRREVIVPGWYRIPVLLGERLPFLTDLLAPRVLRRIERPGRRR